MQHNQGMTRSITKLLLNTVGVIAVLLGIIGIFIPLLPTTPFLLLASACFMRGSTRLHRWLVDAPVIGKILRNYEENRVVPVRAKVIALALMWPSMAFAAYKVGKWPVQVSCF
jgi:uncharacterized membrane protein YbaN (DUF454 family)